MLPPVPAARVLWIVPAVYFLFVSSEFVALTQIAFDLTQRGRSALQVGLVASAFWVGIFLASLIAHRVVDRAGYARSFLGGAILAALAVASLLMHAQYFGWMAGVCVMGVAGGVVWVTGESWLAELSPADQRGFYVGLFETSVGLGMVAGPGLLLLCTAYGVSALAVALVLMVACACACVLLRRAANPMPAALGAHDASAPPPSWRRVAMPLAAVAVLGGLLESGSSALLPGVSLRVGFSVEQAAGLGALIGAGSALLQAPFGLLADRVGLRRAMLATWVLLLLAAAGFVAGAQSPMAVLWWVGFVLGGAGGAVYTLVVIELGHRLNGPGLVKAMSLLVTAYTAGTTVGPSLGGALFDAAGLTGLAIALLAASVAGTFMGHRATRPA